MKAIFIKEDLLGMLKPKSPDEIKANISQDPLLSLKHEINKACKLFWMKGGLIFDKPVTPEQFQIVCNKLDPGIWRFGTNEKITVDGNSFIPVLSTLKNDYYGLNIILYGFIELKNKKFSNKLTKMSKHTFAIDLSDKQQMKNINF